MNIAIVGGGFTGLTLAYKLSHHNHKITIFEKEKALGGLAASFKTRSWQFPLEKHYHHWFTNDYYIINLIKELRLANKLFFPKTLTSIYYQGKIYPFDSPLNLLSFAPLTLRNRLRTGVATLYLKTLPRSLSLKLEKDTAYKWLKKYYGQQAFEIIWKPLLVGKFGKFAPLVNMAWFWARIKKRTPRLGYLKGGYQTLIDALVASIEKRGVKIATNTSFVSKNTSLFDKVIVTTPSPVFLRLYPNLPEEYKKRFIKIHHLHALNLVLISKEKFLKKTYWLNINDHKFPFIAVVQHTNLAKASYYGGNHIIYVANYLPESHPYLKMSKEELFKIYLPYLKKINPSFNFELLTLNFELFMGPFAQPVFSLNYSKHIPNFKTLIKNVYLANMDMIYPWDRGTNYAVELGFKVAEFIEQEKI